MKKIMTQLFSNPLIVKGVVLLTGLIFILLLIHFFQNSLSVRVKDPDTRYRTRKLVSLCGYLIVLLFITVIFSDRLGHLTIAIGIVGAGVAFALQEVIASIGGWFAISFGEL